ncbi:hypothetical protein MHC_03980 [Mycoplasma haemocanis str. Illinois]|uniref:Uncharacterized protein n=1 Tax=Mycoplasma haemocanis (strain Illinois) TaxID=1111676 RepID=H6N7N2_MYCHN|nr:hypothetical protein [Mycoplasma haemocanis]AEW45654.1 hypothetical protein MHC_03980 [Mycoplasma haemocanis str. Illinois]
MAKLLPIFAISALSAVGFGGWYSFSVLRPKDLQQYLEWQGFELASKKGGYIWKAILDEHKSIIVSRTKKLDPKEEDIESWCSSHLPSTDYESFKDDASKICVNNPQTVRAKIIQQDGNIDSLINDSQESKDKEYRISYIFKKHIDGVLALIGFIPPKQELGQEIKENIKDAGKALEAWCKKSLASKPEDVLVDNVKLLCSPTKFHTVKELIENQNEKNLLLTDGNNSSELNAKYEEIKDKASWTKDPDRSSFSMRVDDLKDWCEAMEKKEFSDEGIFSNIYPKFRFRCLKDK